MKQRTAEVRTAGSLLPAGWYLVKAFIDSDHDAGPVAMRLRLSRSTGEDDQVPVTPCHASGPWACVVALEHDCSGLVLVPAVDDRPVSVSQLGILRLSRAGATARMLWSLKNRQQQFDWRLTLRTLGSMLRSGMSAGPRGAAQVLAQIYQRSFATTLGAHCLLRRQPWPAPARLVEFEPSGDLLSHTGADGEVLWEATAGDPQLRIPSARLGTPLPGGWYVFRARIDVKFGEINSPCLYPDYGEGLNQSVQSVLPAPDSRGVISAVVLLKRDVVALRFDPSIRLARFALQGVELKRLTRIGAALRMLGKMHRNGRYDRAAIGRAAADSASTLFRHGPSRAGETLHRHYLAFCWPDSASYESWLHMYDTFSAPSRLMLSERAKKHADGPLLSILLPVYQTPERWLRCCIDSVLSQAYPNWELCIAEDASPSERVRQVLREYEHRDARIRVAYRRSNGHIAEASNTALAMARGGFVGLLDHDDELRPHALLEVVEAIADRPDARLVYSDEDKIDESGRRFQPYFKPDWNPDLLLAQNYLCHFTVIERTLALDVGGFRKGFEGSQDHDLFLRCTERLEPQQVVHIPKVLYHWRAITGSTALRRDAKDYAASAGVNAVKDHLARVGAVAAVEELPHGHYRVRWELPSPAPLVSLIIPTRDKLDLLRTCVDSILSVNRYPALELVIVDNQSSEPETLAYLDELAGDDRIKVLRYDAPFNYSAINNFAVARAAGSVIGLINNDIEVRSGDWLTELVAQALRPEIGAVGSMLYYPDGTIQHAGVVLGLGGIANHPYMHQPRGYPGHGGRALVAQNLSAVTGACLFVRRELYEELEGLDEELAVAFNDVDFCLRLRQRGYRNLWTPFVEIVHHESASRGSEDTPEKSARFQEEVDFMHRRWGDALYDDPAYNPNLSLESVNFDLAFPPRS